MIHKNTQSRCQQLQKQVIRKSLHVFTDALRNAFRGIVYQRCLYNTKKLSCQLIIAKSNVAPLKTTSTPRLELLGVALRLKLISKVVQTFKEEIESIIFWYRNMNILQWIRGQRKNFQYLWLIASGNSTCNKFTLNGNMYHQSWVLQICLRNNNY